MTINRHLIKCLFLLLIAANCCVLLTGCELIDLVKKVVRGTYRSSSEISILVYPPFPRMQEEKDYCDKKKVIDAFLTSLSIKDALANGVAQFNQATESTMIIPIFYKKLEPVFDFYIKDIFPTPNDQIRKKCREKIFDIRDNTEYKTASCIIFGTFDYKESSEAYLIQLCYYDYANDKWSDVSGVVTKKAGRAQEAELQRLLTLLLKRVYDR